MQKSTLVGYMRKSQDGSALKISVSVSILKETKPFQSKDGSEYIKLVVNLEKVQQVISGERAVIAVCTLEE